jgi:type II secretory pathway component PulF
MKFVFKAKDSNGNVREGTVDAVTQDAAVQILHKNSLVPISIRKESETAKIVKDFHKIWERVTQKELMIFFRQLATLIEAKVPLVSSLDAISQQAENKYLKILLKEMKGDVEDGMTFSEALAKHPDTFTPLVVNMVKAGEISGNLQKSVTFIADNIEKNYQLSSKIKGALFYPAFVMAAALIIGFVVITFILPKLTGIIKDMGVAIPWYTSVIMWIGDFMSTYWWAVLLLIVGFVFSIMYYVRTEAGRREWEVLQLQIPVFGKLFRYLYLARFADNFSTLLVAGIPMVRALTIVSEIVGNSVFKSVILRAADEVRSGGNISTVFAQSGDIPPIVTHMAKIGEETGKLGEVLQSTSSFYTSEVENMARNMTSLIEPILIVFLGLGVAILVFAIILPIYNIAGQIS